MAEFRKNLTRFLFPSFIIIIAISVTIMTWLTSSSMIEVCRQNSVDNLQAQATLLANFSSAFLESGQSSALDAKLKSISQSNKDRLTVFDKDGGVIADSWDDPSRMRLDVKRPEVSEALSGKLVVNARQSFSRNARTIYVAVPITVNGDVHGVARVAMSMSAMAKSVSMTYWEIVASGIVVVILASAAAYLVSRKISAPMSELLEGAKKFAQGDLSFRLAPPESYECRTLAQVMNQMAELLEMRINKLTEQRNELEAVLYGMSEAVLAVDLDERIIRVNLAAEKLFGIDASKIKGVILQELIRNSQLQRFVRHTLVQNRPTEGEIIFIGDNEKFLQAHGSPLLDSRGSKIGALIVLNDITRMKKLEVIRRDFVANVSHELKTPITSIKGFLETLKEGAISDPQNAERFLDIAIKHTDRLIAIIEDLLSLSRVETDSEKGEISLDKVIVSEVFSAVERAFADKAKVSEASITYESDKSLIALGNVTLLEQAIGNLVDNAIKYSPLKSSVHVKATQRGDHILITVADKGSGIAKDHLSRIFERFYRVDKSRSRKEGGTGLGLSIVKHIVGAHNGTINVTSSPGSGSVFTMIIPAYPQEPEKQIET